MSPEARGGGSAPSSLLRGLKRLDELELEGRRVLVRLDLDVSHGNAGMPDDAELEPAVATLTELVALGARPIVLAHLGDPEAGGAREPSLESVGARLSALGGWEVYLPDDCLGDASRKVVTDLREGQVALLENLRFQAGERGNSEAFAQELARHAEVYVNDAPRASVDTQASVVALPALVRDAAVGPVFHAELQAIDRLLLPPDRRIGAIFGGPNLGARLELMESLLPRFGVLCAGGGAGMTLLGARGTSPGNIPGEEHLFARGRTLLEKASALDVELLLPVDFTCEPAQAGAEPKATGLGPRTLELFEKALRRASAVVVMGHLELHEPSVEAAASTLRLVSKVASEPSYVFAAGDDTADLLRRGGVTWAPASGYLARGGPATLALLTGRTLPGLEALRRASVRTQSRHEQE